MNIDESIVKPKKPKADGWKIIQADIQELDGCGYPHEIYFHAENNLGVISSVEVAHNPGQKDLGPEYHVSVSRADRTRCSSADALWVVDQFDMDDSDEDNHVPGGFVRNFWKPVTESLIGHVCPCKETESAIKEDKGDFIWRGLD